MCEMDIHAFIRLYASLNVREHEKDLVHRFKAVDL